jgi:neutral ceramidase
MRLKSIMLGLTLAAAANAGTGLRAGIARVDITPSASMQMYGYENRTCGLANGAHDRLFAKALVLEANDSRLAIVTMDLGSIASSNLPSEVASKLHIPVLLLSASHTHSGPEFMLDNGSPSNVPAGRAYQEELEHKIFSAVEEASRSTFPARLGVGRGSLQLGYNRLLLRDNGRARALFENPERVPYGPVDPEFVLLRVEDLNGNSRALVVHYAVHAVVLGPTSCKYSADYPGVMQSTVEQELKGAQVMFVQGGAGDVNPLFMGRSGKEDDDFKVMQTMGSLLGAAVLKANKTVKPVEGGSIKAESETLNFHDRWEHSKNIEVGITTVLINGQIAIATVPGEPMHKLQKMWKEQAEAAYPLFYGYTFSSRGAWAGYIPDLRSAAYGGYGADANTDLEIGAGEKIVLRHLANLYDLRGVWQGKPGER